MNVKLLNEIHEKVNEVASYSPEFLASDAEHSRTYTEYLPSGEPVKKTIIDHRAKYRVIRDVYALESEEEELVHGMP